ncbi:MAG: ATP-dependent RNA helicase HrpA [Deltaproteobacteria bacterium]|nr:ATP-dependent RNA helicase HrpA [Deltaproteobacteria bacterium]
MAITIKKIESLLPDALHRDRLYVQRELSRIKSPKKGTLSDGTIEKRLLKLEKKLQSSINRKSRRKESLPALTDFPDLPIFAKKDEIIDAVSNHRVVIISGETGSGKTTQIPKFCLAAGRGIDGKIGCTQPRRIAATTVSRRIAEELGEEPGRSVGYKIRFQDKTPPDAFIKIMTDGILLAETQSDPYLNEYDTLIIDEAHERSLNIDFILGYLKTLLIRRSDLNVIITSATIDTEKFSKAFDNAPVIEVSGRMYPVEIRYSPITPENDEPAYIETAARMVERLQAESPFGDILIFMPTEQDIRETRELIEGRKYKNVVVLPLFARLSTAEQSKVFTGISARKIIIATNIAETSITIPGIKYVVDTGLARISRYMPRSRSTSLAVTNISQSSAEQRKGRCGRVENGVCIRLFSEEDFLSRSLFTPPEILRANLAEVILRMIALNLGDMSDFPFIDRPDSKSVRDGFDSLVELGAIALPPRPKKSEDKQRYGLTRTGKLMARMPIDPRLSRMLIEGRSQGCLEEMVVIASALSVQDPRERPSEKAEIADQAHKTFLDPFSDFITLLNIWNRYNETWSGQKTTGQKFKQAKNFCKTHFISFKRMREWVDIHGQLTRILKEYRFHYRRSRLPDGRKATRGDDAFSPTYTAIHKSVLIGLLSNIAVKKEKNFFHAAKGREVMVFPGSTLFNRAGDWLVAAEMVETSRLFARTTAKIDAGWLEDLGKDLCRYTYLEPHWERKRGEVAAYEQVSLFGLIIIPRRKVSYGRIHPEEATDIFIRSALVEGDIRQKFSFVEHNKQRTNEVRDMEDRLRRRDIIVSEDEMFLFYKKRLKRCYDIRTLQQRIRKKGDDRFLKMKAEDLLQYQPAEGELSLFPDNIDLGNHCFDCNYTFLPGEPEDGVTVKIPLSYASMVSHNSMDWLVPGLYREKITALIKGLPKSHRKKLVPLATTVGIIVSEMPKTGGALITALGDFIYRRFGLDIPASAWLLDDLPDHLRMRISITGARGEEIHAGRDPAVLRQGFERKTGPEESRELKSARKEWEKTGITFGNFPDLPESIRIQGRDSARWRVYPGLQKTSGKEKSVDLRLFLHRDEALKSHQEGVAALFTAYFAKDLKFLKKALTLPQKTKEVVDYFGGCRRFEKRLFDSVIRRLFHKNLRSGDAFSAHAESTAPEILSSGRELLSRCMPVVNAFHETRTILYHLETENRANAVFLQFLEELRKDLARLVPDNFMELYDTGRFGHLPRYIKAVAVRAQRAVVNFEREQAKGIEITMFTDSLNTMLQALSPRVSEEKRNAVEDYFWLIEEYKVSVFAQELKTAVPVSKKRLEKRGKEIERMI